MPRNAATLTGPIENFVLDAWAALSHKPGMGSGASSSEIGFGTGAQVRMVPTWVGMHRRRLTAYIMYQAYVDGVARNFAQAMDLADRNNYREYGDAKLLRDVLVDALLGDRQEIVVDGAVNYDPDMEDAAASAAKVKAAAALPPPLLPQLGAIPAGNTFDFTPPPDVEGPTPEDLKRNAEAKSAVDREEWLRDWADDDGLYQALKQAEEDAVALGDAFFALGWSAVENRVTVYDLHNPGFYFPVRGDSLAKRDDLLRVHLAWEVDRREDGTVTQVEPGAWVHTNAKRYVHKITFELRDLPDGETRRYPWDEPGQPPSNRTCYMTDGYWLAPVSKAVGVDDFTTTAEFYDVNEEGLEVRDLDLGIDFIPVVHVRNTGGRDWGESALAPLTQLLDDIAFCDSDLAAASATTGTPPIWTTAGIGGSGGGARQVATYGPGNWYTLPEGSSLAQLDTSHALDALTAHREALLHRLSVTARIPASVLGRSGGHAASGILLALTFGPLAAKVAAMRLVRDPVYGDLLTMVQKLAMARGVLDAGTPHDAELSFGTYLPVDKPSVVAEVSGLMSAKAISRETAVRMLMDGGFPIDDAQREVERIEAADFVGAVELDTATGDRQAVYDYLKRDMPAEAPAPLAPITPRGPRLSGAQPAPTGGVGAQPAPTGPAPPQNPAPPKPGT